MPMQATTLFFTASVGGVVSWHGSRRHGTQGPSLEGPRPSRPRIAGAWHCCITRGPAQTSAVPCVARTCPHGLGRPTCGSCRNKGTMRPQSPPTPCPSMPRAPSARARPPRTPPPQALPRELTSLRRAGTQCAASPAALDRGTGVFRCKSLRETPPPTPRAAGGFLAVARAHRRRWRGGTATEAPGPPPPCGLGRSRPRPGRRCTRRAGAAREAAPTGPRGSRQ
mmetsp:Transcript_63802/g.176987  ORF Transcript_63802/g.176987 Transcript_63802/m.176987 type:complete len:224 (-) Transcript_63802:351-1022(-)